MATIIIKSGTTIIAGATVKGSFSYFSGSTIELGPTSTTGFYSGVDAPIFGYAVYKTGGPNGVNVTLAANTTELNNILISAGGTGSTVNQNITWATNTNSVYINSGSTQPYSFLFTTCCTGPGSITGYSSSSTIIVGAYLYSNPQLTTPIYYADYYLVEGNFNCQNQTNNGIFTNILGLVTSTTHSNYCGD
jgi:hypothetical protein